MDFKLAREEGSFREEARDFLHKELTSELVDEFNSGL